MMGSKRTENTLRRKLLAAAVASCFSHAAMAAPSGASVVSGSASIVTSGSTMTVTNTPKAIINWASFGIAAGETVKFVQQSSTSTVLNRVTGRDPSQILGALQSNGRVFLINPNGIMFGANARIDVNGLVASTLNMTDADFLNGRMRFNADRATPGSVTNAGQITTPSGGFVYLLAPNVENSGIITTPSGEAILAAGNSVEIVDSTDPSQRVLVSATSQDVNLSQMMTQSNGDIFSVLNSGTVSANTVVQDQTGKIFFRSAGNIQTTSASVVEARGDLNADGGSFIGFAGQDGIYAGSFDVSGKNGGFIETSGHWMDVNSAQINMRGLDPNGKGGTWLIDPNDICITSDTCSFGSGMTNLLDSSIESALGYGGNVIIATNPSGTGGNGDIFMDASASISPFVINTNSLTLNAARNITLDGFIDIGGSVNLNAGGTVTINGNGSTQGVISVGTASAGSNDISINAANITLNQATLIADNSYVYGSGDASVSLVANDVVINNSEIGASSTNITRIGITGSNSVSISNSFIVASADTGVYASVGINYPLTNEITANPAEFFNFNTTSTVTLNQSDIASSCGIGFAGNDVTLNGTTMSTDVGGVIHGIAKNQLSLNSGSSLYADSEMMLEAGKSINVNGGSLIYVVSPNTLFFNFPLLASGGWFVDGVANAFSGPLGSAILVNGAYAIPGVNFFATFGGGSLATVGSVLYPILNPFLPTYPYPYNPDIAYEPNQCDYFGVCPPGTTGEGGTTGTGEAGATGRQYGPIIPEDHWYRQNEPHQCSG